MTTQNPAWVALIQRGRMSPGFTITYSAARIISPRPRGGQAAYRGLAGHGGIVRDNRSFIGRAVRFLATKQASGSSSTLAAVFPPRPTCTRWPSRSPRTLAWSISTTTRWSGPMVRRCSPTASRSRWCTPICASRPRCCRAPELLRLLDLTQPVAVVCASVLHFVSDEEDPHRIIAEYRDHMAPGSYLAISHGTTGTAENDPDQRRRQRDQCLPSGIGAVACPFAGGNPAFLRGLRPYRPRCGLDKRVAARSRRPARGAAQVATGRSWPQALSGDVYGRTEPGTGRRRHDHAERHKHSDQPRTFPRQPSRGFRLMILMSWPNSNVRPSKTRAA